MAIGGKTKTNEAIIMIYDTKHESEPTRIHKASSVQVSDSEMVVVTGVLAIHAYKDDSSGLSVMGVFDAESSLVLFLSEGDSLKIFSASGPSSSYACDGMFKQNMLSFADPTRSVFCYIDCDSPQKIYTASYFNSQFTLQGYDTSLNIETVLTPYAIHTGKQTWLNLQVLFVGIAVTSESNNSIYVQLSDIEYEEVCETYEIQQDTSFMNRHGGIEYVPFKITEFAQYGQWALICHGESTKKGILIVYFNDINFKDIYITDTANQSRQMEVMSFVISDIDSNPNKGYMTVYDSFNNEYILFKDMQLQDSGSSIFLAHKIELTNNASNPAFTWMTHISKILTDDSGELLAYGGGKDQAGFAFRKATSSNEEICIVMTLGTAISSFTATQIVPAEDRIATNIGGWSFIDNSEPNPSTALPAIELYANGEANVFLEFSHSAQINNPCMIRARSTYNSIKHRHFESFIYRPSEKIFEDKCPVTGNNPVVGIQLHLTDFTDTLFSSYQNGIIDTDILMFTQSESGSQYPEYSSECTVTNYADNSNFNSDCSPYEAENSIITVEQSDFKILQDAFTMESQSTYKLSFYETLIGETQAEIDAIKAVASDARTIEVTVYNGEPCTPAFQPPTFTSSTSATSSFSHYINLDGSKVIEFTGAHDGDCFWTFDLSGEGCFDCDTPTSYDSNTWNDILGAELIGATFEQHDERNPEQFTVTGDTKLTINPIGEQAEADWTLVYTMYDGCSETAASERHSTFQNADICTIDNSGELYVHTFNIDIDDNECDPDPQIDESIWSGDIVYRLDIGQNIEIDLRGVTHNNCLFSFLADQIVDNTEVKLAEEFLDQYNSLSYPTVYGQVVRDRPETKWTLTSIVNQVTQEVIQPNFLTEQLYTSRWEPHVWEDEADPNILTVEQNGLLKLTAEHLNAEAGLYQFTLKRQVQFINVDDYPNGIDQAKHIQYQVNLRYCDSQWPQAPLELHYHYQITSAAIIRTYQILSQNKATSCSKTKWVVIDDATGLIPDPKIFEFVHVTHDDYLLITDKHLYIDDETLLVKVLADLPEETAGNYTFTITESNLSNETDKFEQNIKIEIIPVCKLCNVTAIQDLKRVSGLEIHTQYNEIQDNEVTLAWDSFPLVPIEVHGILIDQSACDLKCPVSVTEFNVTTSFAKAQATSVTYDYLNRMVSLILPKDINDLSDTTFAFEIDIRENQIWNSTAFHKGDITANAMFHTEIQVEFTQLEPTEDSNESFEYPEPDQQEVTETEPEVPDDVEELIDTPWTPPPPPPPPPKPIVDWRPSPPKIIEDLTPLAISQSSVNKTGTLTVEFNKPIFIPEPFLDPILKDQIENIISLKVHSSYFDDDKIEISIIDYKLTQFDDKSFSIDVNFAKPSYITQSLTDQDTLEVKFLVANIFQDKLDYLLLQDDTKISVIMPPQMSLAAFIELQVLEEEVEGPMSFFSIIQLSSNVVLAYGLKYLWNMVNLLQFLVFFQHWKINIDETAQMFTTQIRQLALFEFIDTSFFTDFMKDLFGEGEEDIEEICDVEIYYDCVQVQKDDKLLLRSRRLIKNATESAAEEADDEQDLSRLGSGSFMDNMGIWLLFSALGGIIVLVIVVLAVILRKNQRVINFIRKIKEKIFWNSLIRFVIQGTLGIQISAGAAVVLTLNGSEGEKEGGSTFLKILPSIMIILFFNIVPIVFILVLTSKRYRNRLQEEGIKKQIGNLYALVNPDYTGSLFYSFVYLARRSLYVLITFSLFNYPGIQIQLFIYLTLLYLIYLHHFPVFLDRFTLHIETMNEALFLIMCYHMVLFINLVWLPDLKKSIGQSLVFFVFVLLGTNTIVIVYVSIKQIQRISRLKYLKRIQHKEVYKKDLAFGVIDAAISLNTNFFKVKKQSQYFKAGERVLKIERRFIYKQMRKNLKDLLVNDAILQEEKRKKSIGYKIMQRIQQLKVVQKIKQLRRKKEQEELMQESVDDHDNELLNEDATELTKKEEQLDIDQQKNNDQGSEKKKKRRRKKLMDKQNDVLEDKNVVGDKIVVNHVMDDSKKAENFVYDDKKDLNQNLENVQTENKDTILAENVVAMDKKDDVQDNLVEAIDVTEEKNPQKKKPNEEFVVDHSKADKLNAEGGEQEDVVEVVQSENDVTEVLQSENDVTEVQSNNLGSQKTELLPPESATQEQDHQTEDSKRDDEESKSVFEQTQYSKMSNEDSKSVIEQTKHSKQNDDEQSKSVIEQTQDPPLNNNDDEGESKSILDQESLQIIEKLLAPEQSDSKKNDDDLEDKKSDNEDNEDNVVNQNDENQQSSPLETLDQDSESDGDLIQPKRKESGRLSDFLQPVGLLTISEESKDSEIDEIVNMFELNDADLMQLVQEKHKIIQIQENPIDEDEEFEFEEGWDHRVEDHFSESSNESEVDFLDLNGDEGQESSSAGTIEQCKQAYMLINTVLTLQKPKEKIIYGSELFPCLQRLFTKENLLDEYRARITAILDQLNAQQEELEEQQDYPSEALEP